MLTWATSSSTPHSDSRSSSLSYIWTQSASAGSSAAGLPAAAAAAAAAVAAAGGGAPARPLTDRETSRGMDIEAVCPAAAPAAAVAVARCAASCAGGGVGASCSRLGGTPSDGGCCCCCRCSFSGGGSIAGDGFLLPRSCCSSRWGLLAHSVCGRIAPQCCTTYCLQAEHMCCSRSAGLRPHTLVCVVPQLQHTLPRCTPGAAAAGGAGTACLTVLPAAASWSKHAAVPGGV